MNMTIDQIVRRAIFEMGYTIHQYTYFYNLAIHALQEMQIDTIGNVKELELTQEPKSYDEEISIAEVIGVKYSAGSRLVSIHQSGSISIEAMSNAAEDAAGTDLLYDFSDPTVVGFKKVALSKGAKAGLAIGNEYEYNGFNFNVHGEPKGRLFGSSNGNPQAYKFDIYTQKLAVVSASSYQLYLVYLSGNDEFSPVTVVPAIASEVITTYIKYNFINGKRSASVADKQLAKREHELANRIFRARRFQLSKEAILQSLKSSYGLAPK
jgi:hypothetical protein